nr:transporter associated domain-containing protein [Sediminibacillus massiliensis]
MVDIATAEGTFASDEKHRIKGVIDFHRLDVRDALKTPRMEIIGIPSTATYGQALDIVLNSNHTRYPIYEENMDNIIAVFHAKQLLSWSLDQTQILQQFTDNNPLYVFEFHSIEKVFKQMLKERKHMAIVLDEYGGTNGILTNEDIIEAMIGQEIKDETDVDEEALIEEFSESRIVCNGKISLHRLNEVFRTDIPEEEDILSGFLLREFGYFPKVGDTYVYEDLHFEIKEVEDNKLRTIEIVKQTNE